MPSILTSYRRLAALPLGTRLFSAAVCLKAPYFATIRPRFHELSPGRGVVTAKNRRGVHNHLGTFHAIAMCNMAEVVAGTTTDVSLPPTHRWIPKAMTVHYLAPARTDLRATAAVEGLDDIDAATSLDLIVPVTITDTADAVVMTAEITMRITPKRKAQRSDLSAVPGHTGVSV